MTHRFGLPLSLILTAVMAAGLVSTALAKEGGNSPYAKLCNGDGWTSVLQSDGTAFKNAGDCVSYAAHGGTLLLDCDDAPAGALAATIAELPADATLFVRGTCTGGFPIDITQNLSIVGAPSATVDGQGATTGKALRITTPGVSLTLTNVEVTHGVGDRMLNQGGIITLIDSSIHYNAQRIQALPNNGV